MSSSVSAQEDVWDYTWVSPAIPSHDWRDASYVLIAESHSDDLGKEYNSQLIDQLITPNSMLLVEGVRSQWQTISPVKTMVILRSLRISEMARQKIASIIGWDYFNHRGDQAFFCQLDPPNTVFIGDEERDHPKLNTLARAVRSDSPDNAILGGLQSLLALSEAVSTFPRRTEAMIQTLRAVEQRKALDSSIGKVILVAGKGHLIDRFLGEAPELSLAPLYAELTRLPAAVISIRKS